MMANLNLKAIVQNGIVGLATLFTFLGFWLLMSLLLPGMRDVFQRGFFEALAGITLMVGPAVIVLGLAPVMILRAGPPPGWFQLLSIVAAIYTVWLSLQFAMYAA